jgi:hypothetical protein
MKKRLIYLLPIALFCTLMISTPSCYYDNEADLYPTTTTTPTNCDTTGVKFTSFVSPLIASKCATSGCHSASTSAAGVNLGNYNAIKSYITSSKAVFLGSIKHTSAYSSMPKGGSKLPDCDITKIERWITNGMLNN